MEPVGKQYKILDVSFWGDLDSRHSSLLSVSTVVIAVTWHVVTTAHSQPIMQGSSWRIWWFFRASQFFSHFQNYTCKSNQMVISNPDLPRSFQRHTEWDLVSRLIKWWRVKSGNNFTRFLSEFLLLSEPLKGNFDQTKVKSFLNFTSIPFDYLFFTMSVNLYAYNPGILTCLFFEKLRPKRCYGNLVILQ